MTRDPLSPEVFRRVAVVGTTAWGTTLAVHLARNGAPTVLVARDADEAAALKRAGTNERRLPGVAFPEPLAVDAGGAGVAGADLVVFAVPSG
ncbi:MAG: hypothetical protein EPO16_06285, partial [Dehalococcoidia bacterium]